jgi:hypothetical protein
MEFVPGTLNCGGAAPERPSDREIEEQIRVMMPMGVPSYLMRMAESGMTLNDDPEDDPLPIPGPVVPENVINAESIYADRPDLRMED